LGNKYFRSPPPRSSAPIPTILAARPQLALPCKYPQFQPLSKVNAESFPISSQQTVPGPLPSEALRIQRPAVRMSGSSSHLTATPQLGKPFAWPYPSDTADPGEHVSLLDHSGNCNNLPRTQDISGLHGKGGPQRMPTYLSLGLQLVSCLALSILVIALLHSLWMNERQSTLGNCL
jgi:hypothetical protein